tara:strand:- start:447 stop:1076 length:630 start_codon:yes stop_codon:yes gene_type:complete
MAVNTLKTIFWTFKNIKSIKNWKKRQFSPPSPEVIKHKIIINNNLENCLWIETGTYYGNTTKLLSGISKKTITIEADKYLHENTKKKLRYLKNIEFLYGNSENLLLTALESGLNYKNVCIYLDAHLCTDHIRQKNIFSHKNSETPILNELQLVEKYLQKFEKINILIDDIRLFDKNFQNYPNKKLIVDWCDKNQLSWSIEHDIMICRKL